MLRNPSLFSLLTTPNPALSLALILGTLFLATAALAQQGSLDTTFDGDGKAVVPFDWGGDGTDIAYDVASQFDGKIVAVGAAGLSATNYDFAIVRMNQDGSLDSGFGNGGKVGVAFDLGGDGSDAATAVAIQGDGKVVVAGVVEVEGEMNSDFAVVRLTTSGSLDPSFGNGGKVVVPFDLGGHDFDQVSDVLIQSDGKIVVVGTVTAGWFNRDFAAIRLTASGSLDSTFGTGGKVVVALDQGQIPHDECEAAALQPDGKILLAGSMAVGSGNDRDFAVVRLNSNGGLDPTFGYGGGWTSVHFDVVPAGADDAYSVALDASGRILVAGRAQTTTNGNDQAFAVARLTSSGFSDSTFGSLGRVTLAIPAGQGDDLAVGIAAAANGKIVVAGQTFIGALDADFAVTRLLANGSLDSGFGNGGVALVAFDYGQNDADLATAMTLQLTGAIVVAGWAERASFHDYDFVVARLIGEPFFSGF